MKNAQFLGVCMKFSAFFFQDFVVFAGILSTDSVTQGIVNSPIRTCSFLRTEK